MAFLDWLGKERIVALGGERRWHRSRLDPHGQLLS